MLLNLIILFTVVPALELILLIEVGQFIGAWETVGIIIATGATGAILARSQGQQLLISVKAQMNKGVLPADSLLEGVMIFLGGVLLVTPGFMTDIFGLFLVSPWGRRFMVARARSFLKHQMQQGSVQFYSSYGSPDGFQRYDQWPPEDDLVDEARQVGPEQLADVIEINSRKDI